MHKSEPVKINLSFSLTGRLNGRSGKSWGIRLVPFSSAAAHDLVVVVPAAAVATLVCLEVGLGDALHTVYFNLDIAPARCRVRDLPNDGTW